MGIEGEMSNGGMQYGLSIDEKDGLIDKDEVMIRRMKNRERQRRYRARKRMREEAGIDESLSFETMGQQEEEEELEFDGPSSGYVDNFVRRVYCDRDWKKEARRAHLIMNKAQDGSCESVKRKVRRHRRDWKAEARKKKT